MIEKSPSLYSTHKQSAASVPFQSPVTYTHIQLPVSVFTARKTQMATIKCLADVLLSSIFFCSQKSFPQASAYLETLTLTRSPLPFTDYSNIKTWHTSSAIQGHLEKRGPCCTKKTVALRNWTTFWFWKEATRQRPQLEVKADDMSVSRKLNPITKGHPWQWIPSAGVEGM